MSTTRHARASRAPWIGALLLGGLGQALAAHAAGDDNDRIATLERKLDQSLELIRELSSRVHDLKAEAAQGAAAAAAQPAAPRPALPPAQAGGAAAAPTDTAGRLAPAEQPLPPLPPGPRPHPEDP